MKLLTQSEILKRFESHASAAQKIDISVAWVTNAVPLKTLHDCAVKNQSAVRVILGKDGNLTPPLVIDYLQQFAQIRVAESTKGIFHPKMYIFYLEDETIVWIGSANFTKSGFTENEELVAELSLSHQEAISWFNSRWESITEDGSAAIIKKYKEDWLPPPPPPRKTKESNKKNNEIQDIVDPFNEMNLHCSWSEYVTLLERMNIFWIQTTQGYGKPFSVTGDSSSYLETISDGNVLTNLNSWDNLTYIESVMLLGINDDYGMHGLLGSMRGAGYAKNIFLEASNKNLEIRKEILSALQYTILAENKQEYVDAAQDALKTILTFQGVGIAVATRLLALARPDMALSVNKAAQTGLAKLSGLKPGTIMNWKKYTNLLNWLYDLEWYNAPMPSEPWEKALWEKRAALVDCFVYDDRMAQRHSKWR